MLLFKSTGLLLTTINFQSYLIRNQRVFTFFFCAMQESMPRVGPTHCGLGFSDNAHMNILLGLFNGINFSIVDYSFQKSPICVKLTKPS